MFGLITDLEECRLAWLDENHNSFLSETYLWMMKKIKIIQWIDGILRDSDHGKPSEGQFLERGGR